MSVHAVPVGSCSALQSEMHQILSIFSKITYITLIKSKMKKVYADYQSTCMLSWKLLGSIL